MSVVTVEIDGLAFVNAWQLAEDGCAYTFSRLDPWYGGGGVRLARAGRASAHGEFSEQGFRAGKTPVLQGAVSCPTRAAAAVVVERLAALLGDGSTGEMTVDDPDVGQRMSRVQLAAEPVVDWSQSSTTVFFQLPFLAPDPLRYGPLQSLSTGFPDLVGGLEFDLYTDGAGTDLGYLDYGVPSTTGTVELVNPGTADSWPVFEVTGPTPADGFEIIASGTGRRIVYSGLVPSGSRLVVDTAAGTVLMDGVSDRTLSHFEPTPVPRNGSQAFTFIPNGSRTDAVLTASSRPAYW